MSDQSPDDRGNNQFNAGDAHGYARAVADVVVWLRINPGTIETSLLAERLESGSWKGTKP